MVGYRWESGNKNRDVHKVLAPKKLLDSWKTGIKCSFLVMHVLKGQSQDVMRFNVRGAIYTS